MLMYPFELQFTPGHRQVLLRELCGQDELKVAGYGTADAIHLIKGMIGQGQSLQAGAIATADRDRLLAAVYRHTYGARIESTIHCRYCNALFDVVFSLDDLLLHTQPERDKSTLIQTTEGWYQTAEGHSFRLPTGDDELAVSGLPVDEAVQMLLARCTATGTISGNTTGVQEAMEQVAPLLQKEMLAHCPECSKEQQVSFDMQSFLLVRLKNDQRMATLEIHQLAMAYHWSHQEILQLPRSLRRTYAAFIEAATDTQPAFR
ncbi:hypothetical protein L3C95_33005 [Chitinophaga filiformis]|uniref:hypothetical protein n=1 Tax=Chitinophaga filiformis TaxID=104663 RepID=UPI001F1DA27D|nr:hypothetical protein [Chitinophaga filiformis]MCF6407753.1 hypothetical protein [Chitinophaga filiformis]